MRWTLRLTMSVALFERLFALRNRQSEGRSSTATLNVTVLSTDRVQADATYRGCFRVALGARVSVGSSGILQTMSDALYHEMLEIYTLEDTKVGSVAFGASSRLARTRPDVIAPYLKLVLT